VATSLQLLAALYDLGTEIKGEPEADMQLIVIGAEVGETSPS
jgi:hypothetical protein